MLVLFDPQIEPYHIQPLRNRVDLEEWEMKGFLTFPNASASRDFTISVISIISQAFIRWGVLPLCRDAVDVFYSPGLTGKVRERGRKKDWGQRSKRELPTLRVTLWHRDIIIWFNMLHWWIFQEFLFPVADILMYPKFYQCWWNQDV